MRKIIILLTMLALLTVGITGAIANQEQVDIYDKDKNLVKSVVFVLGMDQYFVNGQTPGIKMDAKPFAEQGRTFVPIRFLSNALGVTGEHIGWTSPKVTLDEPGFPVVELAVGSKQLKSDGKATTMDVAPLAKDGRTYLPARWVAEALGYQVDWMPEHNIVLCYPKGADAPDIGNVIEHIQKPGVPVQPVPEPEPVKPEVPVDATVIDLAGQGEPVTNYEFSKYLKPTSKVNWLTYEEFNSNIYELGGVKTYGMRVTKDKVYITQESGCGRAWFYEGGDVLRVRNSSGPTREKYEYGYTVALEADKGVGWGMCDITKVIHIFFDAADGTFLAIENPLYQGGK